MWIDPLEGYVVWACRCRAHRSSGPVVTPTSEAAEHACRRDPFRVLADSAVSTSTSLSLLVVEDDRAVARAIARLLKRRGHRVAVAGSYAAGLAVTEVFDCGIFDVDLPDGSGIDLAADLRDAGRVRRCVFFSASPAADTAVKAQRLGEFIHKTAGVGELARAVGDALRSTRRAKTANGSETANGSDRPRKGSGLRKKV